MDSFSKKYGSLSDYSVSSMSGRLVIMCTCLVFLSAIMPGVGCSKNDISSESLISDLNHKDWRLRVKAAEQLGKKRDTKAIPLLIALIHDEDADVVDAAGKSLVMIGLPAVPELIKAMKDDSFYFNTEPDIVGASKVLSLMPNVSLEQVIASLNDDDCRIRANAAKVLGEIGDLKAVTPLCNAMNDEVWRVRVNARWALTKIGNPSADSLISLLNSKEPSLRDASAITLGKIKDSRAISALQTAFKEDKVDYVRVNAALSLGELRDKSSIDILITAISDKKTSIRNSALAALRNIAGRDFGENQEKWLEWRKVNP